MRHAAAALELAVGALLHVVGAQPDVVLVGEVQVGQGLGLGLFQHLGGLGAETLDLPDGELAEPAHVFVNVVIAGLVTSDSGLEHVKIKTNLHSSYYLQSF